MKASAVSGNFPILHDHGVWRLEKRRDVADRRGLVDAPEMSTRADSPFRDSRRDTREPLPGIGVISYPWQVLGLLQPRGVNRTSSPSHAGHFGTAAMPVEAIMSRSWLGCYQGIPPSAAFRKRVSRGGSSTACPCARPEHIHRGIGSTRSTRPLDPHPLARERWPHSARMRDKAESPSRKRFGPDAPGGHQCAGLQ